MRIGFIGAGKMGNCMGKHITSGMEQLNAKLESMAGDTFSVTGYYSHNIESAKAAALFTDTKYYGDIEDIARESDILFLTVPDGEIEKVAYELDNLDVSLDGKILCHTSGALSSQIFSSMNSQIYGYSIHPMYAVNSKTESYKKFSECFITIEGNTKYLELFKCMYEALGHDVKLIESGDKVKYHAASVFASNLVVGLYDMSVKLLSDCGFERDEAEAALRTLFINNAENICKKGTVEALTGPVERIDISTVKKHMDVLENDELSVYELLSRQLCNIVEKKKGQSKELDELRDLLK